MKQDMTDKLNNIFRDVFKDEHLQIKEDMTSGDVARWDSLSHLTLISTIEEQFQVKFKLKELVNMRTVGDLMRNLEEKTT